MHALRPRARRCCDASGRAARPPRRLLAPASAAALALSLAAGLACRHAGQADIATLASGSDTALWNSASKDLAKKRYDTARQYASRLIEGFPNSAHQPAARLLVADSYFHEGGSASLLLAAAAYREFTSLFPSHPRADYAQFQVAECYFKQRHRPDRDQTSTQDALQEYERFLALHPDSPLAEKARERVKRCQWSLARAEFLIGAFYQRTRSYRAATQRLQGILTDYPQFDQTDEVLFRLGQILGTVGRPKEAVPYLERLIDGYPKSPLLPRAKRLQARLLEAPTPTPAPAAGK